MILFFLTQGLQVVSKPSTTELYPKPLGKENLYITFTHLQEDWGDSFLVWDLFPDNKLLGLKKEK